MRSFIHIGEGEGKVNCNVEYKVEGKLEGKFEVKVEVIPKQVIYSYYIFEGEEDPRRNENSTSRHSPDDAGVHGNS